MKDPVRMAASFLLGAARDCPADEQDGPSEELFHLRW